MRPLGRTELGTELSRVRFFNHKLCVKQFLRSVFGLFGSFLISLPFADGSAAPLMWQRDALAELFEVYLPTPVEHALPNSWLRDTLRVAGMVPARLPFPQVCPASYGGGIPRFRAGRGVPVRSRQGNGRRDTSERCQYASAEEAVPLRQKVYQQGLYRGT